MIRRAGVLASPVFAGAVAILAVNDHVLKSLWPGLVTGKLSDVAGVMVVAIALSVAVGRTVGVGLTAVGFAALKGVPGVNVLAAPLLGGVTMADATDLVALTALVPTFIWLGRVLRITTHSPSEQPSAGRIGVVGGLAAVAAVLATTATSCMTDDGVTLLVVDDHRLYAGITPYAELAHYDLGERDPYWMVSDDGGLTWSSSSDAPSQSAIHGAEQACRGDGCWEVMPGDQVSFCATDGTCEASFRFTDAERERMVNQEACLTKPYDEFNSVVALPGADGNVVVAMGSDGVLARTADGEWHRQAVGHLSPTPIGVAPAWVEDLAFVAPLVLLAASPLVFLVRLRRRGTMVGIGFLIAFVGALGLVMLSAMLAFLETRHDVRGPVIAAAAVAIFAISVAVARLRRAPDG